MTRYRNLSGRSNIEAYELGSDFIIVKFFNTRRTYQYSYRKAGRVHVEAMKRYAQRGTGLNSYIKTNANYLYD